MDTIKRDIALEMAKQIYAQGVFSILSKEHPIDGAKTLTKNALLLGEIWANAQIEYCERGAVPLTEEQEKLLEGKVW